MHFVEQNLNINKIETESKMENPTHSFRQTFFFNLIFFSSSVNTRYNIKFRNIYNYNVIILKEPFKNNYFEEQL